MATVLVKLKIVTRSIEILKRALLDIVQILHRSRLANQAGARSSNKDMITGKADNRVRMSIEMIAVYNLSGKVEFLGIRK